MLECVVNISEGRDADIIARLKKAAGNTLLDVHTDRDHHRSVFTFGGAHDEITEDVQRFAMAVIAQLSLRDHKGIHPRIGVLDVVPFVPYAHVGQHVTWEAARDARDTFAYWLGHTLHVPAFLYGPERTLPFVRLHAFTSLRPDAGPTHPHPTAGACAVGVREPLVAYNVWLDGDDEQATATRAIAQQLRSAHVRTLGLRVGDKTQVSMNLVCPMDVGPMDAYDAVCEKVRERQHGTQLRVVRAELVGLLPDPVLRAIPAHRWKELDVSVAQTIEVRASGNT